MKTQMDLFGNEQSKVISGAEFSECGKYRYALWRIWDDELPKIMFVGLNPSTANATMDDNTIRRVRRFAVDWGYGGVYMCNLFAYISTDPKALLTCENPVGNNDRWLMGISDKCSTILFAWGSFKEAKKRAAQVEQMFPQAICLGITNDGSPKHPLYIAANTKPINYK